MPLLHIQSPFSWFTRRADVFYGTILLSYNFLTTSSTIHRELVLTAALLATPTLTFPWHGSLKLVNHVWQHCLQLAPSKISLALLLPGLVCYHLDRMERGSAQSGQTSKLAMIVTSCTQFTPRSIGLEERHFSVFDMKVTLKWNTLYVQSLLLTWYVRDKTTMISRNLFAQRCHLLEEQQDSMLVQLSWNRLSSQWKFRKD